MIKIKRKGSFLIETIVAAGLFFIIFIGIFIKYTDLKEEKDLRLAINILENTVQRYSMKSIGSKKSFKFKLDYKKKIIIVASLDSIDPVIEQISLPSKLNYITLYNKEFIGADYLSNYFEFTTKTNGNLSNAFSIYICDYSDNAAYRISFSIFQQSHILKINTYKNISNKKIKSENLKIYHYNEEEKKADWIRQ